MTEYFSGFILHRKAFFKDCGKNNLFLLFLAVIWYWHLVSEDIFRLKMQIGIITARDAHIAGLLETAPGAVLAEDCYNLLKKIVVK